MQNEVANSTTESNPGLKKPFYRSALIRESLLNYHAWGSFQVEQADGSVVRTTFTRIAFIAPVGSFWMFFPKSRGVRYLGVPSEARDLLEVDLLMTFSADGKRLITPLRYKKHILPVLRGALC